MGAKSRWMDAPRQRKLGCRSRDKREVDLHQTVIDGRGRWEVGTGGGKKIQNIVVTDKAGRLFNVNNSDGP